MKFLLSINDLVLEKSLDSNKVLELGYDGIEYSMPSRMSKVRQITEHFGKELRHVQVIHAPQDYYDKNNFQSALKDAMSLADKWNVSVVNIHPASSHPDYGGRSNVLEEIDFIKRQELEYGNKIQVCYEVLGYPRTEDKVKEVAYDKPEDWLNDVIEFDLNGTLDTTHLGSYSIDPASYIDKLGGHLKHVHLSDYDLQEDMQHMVPGEGSLPLNAFLQKLQKKEANISVTVEPSKKRYLESYEDVARRSIEYIREVIS